jgi:hypothetical protein
VSRLKLRTRLLYDVVGSGSVRIVAMPLGQDRTRLDLTGLDPPPELRPGDRICVDGTASDVRYVVLRPKLRRLRR